MLLITKEPFKAILEEAERFKNYLYFSTHNYMYMDFLIYMCKPKIIDNCNNYDSAS